MTFPALEYDILRSIFQHLPSKDLFSVVQACSSFYSLAIDILYQDITYPFADYARDNISFWPNIASVHRAVRTVSFTNDPQYMVPKFAIERFPSSGGFDVWPASACSQAWANERTPVLHSSDPRVAGHDSKILPILQILSTPSFPFLHTVSFVNVVFFSLRGLLSILSGLDSLRTLKIERCDFECQWYSHAHPTVAEIAAFSALPITSLVLRQTSGHHAHLFFCTASHLKSLRLSVGSRWLGPFLAKRFPLSYAFSDELGSLRLEAPVDRYFGGEFGLQVVDFLQNECQNLRELIIDAEPAQEDDGPSSSFDPKATNIAHLALLSPLFMPENFPMPHLPQLESFSGSWGFLHSVLKAGCQLKRIKVVDVQSVQDAVSGLEEVASYNSGSTLEEIEIKVLAWDADILDTVSRLFPDLKFLRVEHYGHIDISAFEVLFSMIVIYIDSHDFRGSPSTAFHGWSSLSCTTRSAFILQPARSWRRMALKSCRYRRASTLC